MRNPHQVFSLAGCLIAAGPTGGSAFAAPGQTGDQNAGELLYNGIRLPAIWPPRLEEDNVRPAVREPMPVPYLTHPPAVIRVDVGRQLLVDDFLIERTDLKRTFHDPERYDGNPVFKPETRDELGGGAGVPTNHGGIFFDPRVQAFKMFYNASTRGPLSLATSPDLIHWTRPKLTAENDNVLIRRSVQDNCVWLDLDPTHRDERIKVSEYLRGKASPSPERWGNFFTSPDGLNWSDPIPVIGKTFRTGDYCSFFKNPFRDVWVYSIKRQAGPLGRHRYYHESVDFRRGADWNNAVFWTGADRLDDPEPEGSYHPAAHAHGCQLYSLNAVAYESLMIGMYQILRGPRNPEAAALKLTKLTDLSMAFSRDGFHWDRPNRKSFLAGTRQDGDWDRAYLRVAAGVFAVFGDKLVFPYTGYSGYTAEGIPRASAGASIGLATLRRDGFASMDGGPKMGTLTTRPLSFSGKRLFINADAPRGRLRVEVRDRDGNPIAPFTLANSIPFSGDRTLEAMRWKGGADLSALAGKQVRLHFEVTNGSLYSFWISRDDTGRSDGYVAAGGPGYNGVVDTVGRAAPDWRPLD